MESHLLSNSLKKNMLQNQSWCQETQEKFATKTSEYFSFGHFGALQRIVKWFQLIEYVKGLRE